ncbi:MAG TPA: protein kinase [Kofleriaceae bacterium]|jgi:serine/threonine-protein kinase
MAPGNGADASVERQYACTICRVLYRSDFSRCPRDGGEVVAIDTWDDPLLGATLAGRYLIEELIGEGGMGRVYRAVHHELPRHFAIKVLFGELAALSEMRQRFRMEAESAARLDHPNLVPVVDVGETEEGLLYLAMEYVPGQNLADIISSEGPLEPIRAASLARRLCRGLQHAHERGMVHRDFKPDNVIVVEEDGVEVPRIADFGLAVLVQDAGGGGRLTRKGETMGTPPYMSPEQLAAGRVDARSDLYSLGVVLYEMLTTKTPFEGSIFDVLRQVATEPPPPMATRAPNVAVPPELERVAMKLLAARPEDRYASAAEVIADLEVIAPPVRTVGRRTSAPMALTSPPAAMAGALPIDDEPAPPVAMRGARRRAASDTGEMLALVKRHRRVLSAVVMVGVALAVVGIVVTLANRNDDREEGGGDEQVALSDQPATTTAPAPAVVPPPEPAATPPIPAPVAAADAAPPAPEPAAAPPDAAPAPAPEEPPAPASEPHAAPTAKAKSVARGKPKEKDKPRAAPAAAAAPAQSADELYREGTKLYLTGRLADARKKYESALAQNSRYPAAHRGLGFVYQRMGDRARALKYLKRYLELSPRAGDAAEVRKRIDALGG